MKSNLHYNAYIMIFKTEFDKRDEYGNIVYTTNDIKNKKEFVDMPAEMQNELIDKCWTGKRPVYISVDKDVLDEKEYKTNKHVFLEPAGRKEIC